MNLRRAIGLGAALALAGAPGCGEQTCEIPGCMAENLTLAPLSRCWPDGSYEVRGTLDGRPFSVAFVLPGAGGASETGEVSVRTSVARGVEEVAIVGTPATVELELFHEGVSLGRRTFSDIPYRDRLVGGGDCDPTNCGPGAKLDFPLDPAAVGALCAVSEAGGGAP